MAENKFVVKTVSMLRDKPKVLVENQFTTKEEAEGFQRLMNYAMELKHGKDQTAFSIILEEL